MEPLVRTLLIAGLALVATALVLHFGPSLGGLGRLPGDIVIEREGEHGTSRFYFPVVTCLVLSVVLSLAVWLFGRFR